MKLIVGLGNPGKEYDDTRHNVGFKVIDEVIKRNEIPKPKEKFNGLYCEYINNGEKIILLKPQSYMNLSGSVVIKYLNYFNISVSDLLIISDDLDLEMGKCRLRPSGGTGGHNGLKDISINLGTEEYKRLRVGISKNKDFDTKDYVLGKFDEKEKEEIKEMVGLCSSIVEDFTRMSFEELMNKYNKKV